MPFTVRGFWPSSEEEALPSTQDSGGKKSKVQGSLWTESEETE